MLAVLADQLRDVAARVAVVEGELMAWHRASEVSRRLATIPGVGPITASAIVATVGDATQFKSGRQFAAWLGLVPQQRSSGGKERLGRIPKRGDGYIRRLMIHGARAVVGWRKRRPMAGDPWLGGLLARRHVNVATVAFANKSARIAWALMARGRSYTTVRARAA
jgi:transposase